MKPVLNIWRVIPWLVGAAVFAGGALPARALPPQPEFGTCARCHGTASATTSTTINVLQLPTVGQTVTLRIATSRGGMIKSGFVMHATAGSFPSAGQASNVTVNALGDAQHNTTSPVNSYDVLWTAPSTPGRVGILAWTTAVNDDGTTGGDAPLQQMETFVTCVAGTTETLCAGKECGLVPTGCGTDVIPCGTCIDAGAPICGGAGAYKCGKNTNCTPTTCAAAGKNCGAILDGCNNTIFCGTCSVPGEFCGGGGTPNVCGAPCVPTTCTAQGKNCGTISDGCGRTLNCGTCPEGQNCGAVTPNVCASGCTPESDAVFCTRLGKQCGSFSGTDNCAQPRTATCGPCTAPQVCSALTPNTCCTPETNAAFCTRLGKTCGLLSGADNCGTTRTNVDCGQCCGNGVVDASAGETCDNGPSSPTPCPTSCADAVACTTDSMTGSAATCNVACSHVNITSCTGGDGCCPTSCNKNNDADCVAVCGNNIVETGELCDGNCPTSCSDGEACTTDVLSGTACTRACTYPAITACASGDGCCPSGCNKNTDPDCSAVCGNNVIEAGEICDGNCPTSCSDGQVCTSDVLSGTACTRACTFPAITVCATGDGCCPTGCNRANDPDCTAVCGNSIVEPGELCDGNCPTTCADANPCTADALTGTACTRACTFTPITVCAGGDGCCPTGCNANNDGNCTPDCGNGIVERGELCDGNCPTTCADGNPCTLDALNGSAANCNATCTHAPISACSGADGCCPTGCNANNDANCAPKCGNGVVETGEVCDGNCPTSCADADPCTVDALNGSAANCSASCAHTAISECRAGDSCCPSACNFNVDADCSARCGNGAVEQNETCDPPSTCPTCTDTDPCTRITTTGSAANCNLACVTENISQCTGGDGCCPSSCNANLDTDCQVHCGNGAVEAGETCDPPSSCPTCNDGVACTRDVTTGSAATCNVACSTQPITACAPGDGCCPTGCNGNTDSDCPPCTPEVCNGRDEDCSGVADDAPGLCVPGSECRDGLCRPVATADAGPQPQPGVDGGDVVPELAVYELGGCACSSAGASLAPLIGLALAFGAARRRRR